jgi:hypothetical protein
METVEKITRPSTRRAVVNPWQDERGKEEIRRRADKSAEEAARQVKELGRKPKK